MDKIYRILVSFLLSFGTFAGAGTADALDLAAGGIGILLWWLVSG